MKRAILACLVTLALVGCVDRPGTRARARIRPGMTLVQVLDAAQGWLSCRATLTPPPSEYAQVEVWPQALAVQGFGEGDGRFQYANLNATTDALTAFIRAHPGSWKLTFGYVTVPRREYFDVSLDGDLKALAPSDIRYGGPR